MTRIRNAEVWIVLAVCAVLLGTMIARADDVVAIRDTYVRPHTTVQVPILLSSSREIGAARVSFFDYDATGVTFGGVERGRHCPPTWSFAVFDSMPEYPGAVLVQTIGSGLDFVTGTDLEIFTLIFNVADCGSLRPLTLARDSQLTHLSTLQLNTVSFSCAGFACCCLPLTLDDGQVVADCTVDRKPHDWSGVKARYR